MAKPATPFTWATNTNYATGPSVGTPTKVTPGAGDIQDGFIPTYAAIPQHVNYALDALGDWTAYLDNLPAEPAFLNNNFAFGGTVTCTGLTVNGNAAITGTCTVDGVSNFNQTVHVNGASHHLEVHSGDIHIWTGRLFIDSATSPSAINGGLDVGGPSPLTATGGVETHSLSNFKYLGSSTKTVTKVVGHEDLVPPVFAVATTPPFASLVGFTDTYASWSLAENAQEVSVPLRVPHGSTVTQVRVRGSKNVNTNAIHKILLTTRGATNSAVQQGASVNATVGGDYDLVVYSGSFAVSGSQTVTLRMTATADMALTDSHLFYSVQVTYETNKPTDDVVVP